MDLMRDEYVPQTVCLGYVPAGSIIVLPNEEDNPFLVTNNKRTKTVSGGTVDTVGIVSCDNGTMFWFADRYSVILVEYATLVYRLAGRSAPKHD